MQEQAAQKQSQKIQFSLKQLIVFTVLLGLNLGLWIDHFYGVHLVEVGRFPITIDYSRTLEEMVAVGRYDHYYPKIINSTNFSIEKSVVGKIKREAVLFRFDQYKQEIDSGDILEIQEKMKIKGFRPGTLPELLALGAQYPELQRSYVILELGSEWIRSDGAWYVICICGDKVVRVLGSFAYQFDRERMRFLAFRN